MWRALALRMGMPLRELRRRMTHAEFVGWREFFLVQPFDDERCYDLPAAQIQATVANRHRGSEEKPYRHIDFMPYREPPPDPSDEDLDAQVLAHL